VLVGGGGDGRQLRDDAMGEDLPVPRIVDVGRVVIEGRHRSDHGGDHGHRMRVVMKALKKLSSCSFTMVWRVIDV
jgi:hypothetical protein